MKKDLKLLVYDKTRPKGEAFLRSAWSTGARLYKALGHIDAFYGASDWPSALQWLASVHPDRKVQEIQYWGHGRWGAALIQGESLSIASLEPAHAHAPLLARVRERLQPSSLIWFRTCETFGAQPGQRFAEQLAVHMGCRVAGHTHEIGVFQSGLQGLRPGEKAHWPESEGLAQGTPGAPERSHMSHPKSPRGLHFMNARIPAAWFDPDPT
jgi:hypothetical protein